MMHLIADLLMEALRQLYEHAVIDWHPDDGLPDTFAGECEIERFADGDWSVILNGVYCIMLAHTPVCWHSNRLEVKVSCNQ